MAFPFSNLPAELKSQVLTQRYTEPPVCAFHIFTPGWGICQRQHGDLEKLLRHTRFDTYTSPTSPGQKGTITTTFDHGKADHLYLPMMEDPRGLEELGPFFQRELARAWLKSLIQIEHLQPELGPLLDEELEFERMLRDYEALTLLPYEDDWAFRPLLEVGNPILSVSDAESPERNWKDVLPLTVPGEPSNPYYKHIRHLMLNTPMEVWRMTVRDVVTMPISGQLTPTAQSILNKVNYALCLERSQCLRVQWRRLEALDTLFLDLRGYSWGFTTDDDEGLAPRDVVYLAHSLVESTPNLKMLVIAGLRSYMLYTGINPLNIETAEAGTIMVNPFTDQEYFGASTRDGINWIMMFRAALRPGGKLILVDRQSDELEVPLWPNNYTYSS